jgi:hypothetical protein
MQASYTLLENIKRDANNCDESLKACRKLYCEYGVITESTRLEEMKRAQYGVIKTRDPMIKQKRQAQKVFTNMAIQNYKKCIELLRKRQEKFLLI